MWTWIKGSDSFNSIGSFGAQGVESNTNNPPALYEVCEWTDLQGNFWIYGGTRYENSTYYINATLWKYNSLNNQWTWMNGDTTYNVPINFGTRGVAAATNQPGSRGWGIATWVDNQGNLWMFGGSSNTGNPNNYADMWKYDIATNMWTWMNGPGTENASGIYGIQGQESVDNYPPSRSETNASWTDNSGKLWLFGGYDSIGGTFNDLWRYNPQNNMWAWIRGSNQTNPLGNWGTMGVQSPSNDPSGRVVYSKWKDNSGNLWIFGGGDFLDDDFYNDLWRYSVAANMWTWVKGSNTPNTSGSYGTKCQTTSANNPPSRFESRSCWKDSCGNFWMFGGSKSTSSGAILNDLWHYHVFDNKWTWVSGSNTTNANPSWGTMGLPALTNLPGARIGSVSFKNASGNIYFWGGLKPFSNFYNDLWRFSPDPDCICAQHQVFPPQAYFTTEGDIEGCAPFSVSFINLSLNENSWYWDFGDSTYSFIENPVHTYTEPGQYTVTLIVDNGIATDTIQQVNCISVLGVSPFNITQNGDTLSASEALNYQWYLNDTLISGANSQNYLITQSGYYYVTTTTGNCTTTSNIIESSCICVGIEEISSFMNFSIYPNPTHNITVIKTLISNGVYQLYDLTSKLLLSGTVTSTQFNLDLSLFSSGVYFISVTDGERQVNGKVVKK